MTLMTPPSEEVLEAFVRSCDVESLERGLVWASAAADDARSWLQRNTEVQGGRGVLLNERGFSHAVRDMRWLLERRAGHQAAESLIAWKSRLSFLRGALAARESVDWALLSASLLEYVVANTRTLGFAKRELQQLIDAMLEAAAPIPPRLQRGPLSYLCEYGPTPRVRGAAIALRDELAVWDSTPVSTTTPS